MASEKQDALHEQIIKTDVGATSKISKQKGMQRIRVALGKCKNNEKIKSKESCRE